MKRLILASGSPRRKELLENAGISFEVVPSTIEERMDETKEVHDIVMSLALQKAADVAKSYPEGFVLGADTVVALDGEILGKPEDDMAAREMLKTLSGRVHTVYTGVALVTPQAEKTFYSSTDVRFWNLTEEEIESYLASGEPYDKAGAYGIQGLGALFVKEISGDYFSVVGLPVSRTVRELSALGFFKN
ncbi:Maf family protein [Bacillus marinisedimentorum]|uniref:Maf family protein n=1 Tax=Bacillus marinisedimentorum TaxID=1821260 RepID=UPI0008724C85|nr:Maf family protein [Bacillus marinisedimentorum]